MKGIPWLTAATFLVSTGMAFGEAPQLQTTGTVIYLADNLDEADQLGWCIDTRGRGWSEQVQAHSCKPQGGDVQFGYRADALQIFSVEFEGKCMVLANANDASVPFELVDCDPTSAQQQFGYDENTGRFFVAESPGQCVVAGVASRRAGPFMSRDLILGNCETTDPRLSTWVIQTD